MYKLYPVGKLTSEFQTNVINKVICDLCNVAGTHVDVVVDNNKINQVCADEPFYGIVANRYFYLLNDIAHI